jgi:uracil-DNA glycosylase family 4
MTDVSTEVAALLREVRGLLEYEEELGGPGVPHVPYEPRRSPEAAPASVTAPPLAAAVPVSAAARPGPAASGEDGLARLTVLAEQAAGCTACRLHESRTKSVFARGNPASEIVFVGEGPGYNEDQTGLPFVGAAGQLLDKMIVAMGYAPDDVYICNVVKCRPPENRTPQTDEATACAPYLIGQLEVIAPKVIVALGKCAADLGAMPEGGRGWRGQWSQYQGIPVMPTYHPAFLLRSPEFKRQVWDDLKIVLDRLGRKPRGA